MDTGVLYNAIKFKKTEFLPNTRIVRGAFGQDAGHNLVTPVHHKMHFCGREPENPLRPKYCLRTTFTSFIILIFLQNQRLFEI